MDVLELTRTLDPVYILMTSCLVTASNTYFLNWNTNYFTPHSALRMK